MLTSGSEGRSWTLFENVAYIIDIRYSQLLAIRLGSGAAILPKNVSKVHMRFAAKIDGGHMGPRYAFSPSIPGIHLIARAASFGAMNSSA